MAVDWVFVFNQRAGVAWPAEKKAEFTELWLTGARGSEIMVKMGLSYLGMVYNARRRYGLPARPLPEKRAVAVEAAAKSRRLPPTVTPTTAVALQEAARNAGAKFREQYDSRHSNIKPTAKIRANAKSTANSKERNCLRCSKRFVSDGPGNRMCDYCRGKP